MLRVEKISVEKISVEKKFSSFRAIHRARNETLSPSVRKKERPQKTTTILSRVEREEEEKEYPICCFLLLK